MEGRKCDGVKELKKEVRINEKGAEKKTLIRTLLEILTGNPGPSALSKSSSRSFPNYLILTPYGLTMAMERVRA